MMIKKEFIVYVNFPEESKEIDDELIELAIKNYLISFSDFYWDNIKVKEIENSEERIKVLKRILDPNDIERNKRLGKMLFEP